MSRYGVSATKLRSQGCALQLVLLPFGEDKESMDEYVLYKGEKCGQRCGCKCGKEAFCRRSHRRVRVRNVGRGVG